MSSLDSCRFQQILDNKSSVKGTLFTFNKVSFVRKTCLNGKFKVSNFCLMAVSELS